MIFDTVFHTYNKLCEDPFLTFFKPVFAGLFSLVFGLIAVITNDLDAVLTKGFFQGYTPTVGVIIFLQVNLFFQMSSLNNVTL